MSIGKLYVSGFCDREQTGPVGITLEPELRIPTTRDRRGGNRDEDR